MERHTFYGRVIEYSDLSHQHLSNIMWFNEVLLNGLIDTYAENELLNRFGGIKLPYAPVHSFNWEIDRLFERGYITNMNPMLSLILNGLADYNTNNFL